MNTKTTLPISKARKEIFKIAEDVQKPSVHYTLTEKGKAKAVIMSADEFESWQETLEVMEEFSDLYKEAKRIDKAVETGEYKKWTSLDDIMAKYGYVLADKGDNKYEVRTKSRKKRAKRAK
jgi:prevent-host-death family protein